MTVGELIEELKKYPPDMDVFSKAADCGGYDAIFVSDMLITPGNKHPDLQEDYQRKTFGEYLLCLYVGGKDEAI